MIELEFSALILWTLWAVSCAVKRDPLLEGKRTLEELMTVGTTTIPNQYIVVLTPGEKQMGKEEAKFNALHGAKTLRRFNRALKGFALEVNDPESLTAILQDADVDYVEQDEVVDADLLLQSPTPSWGIDRIDQPNLPLTLDYAYEYTGMGVEMYFLDSGMSAMPAISALPTLRAFPLTKSPS